MRAGARSECIAGGKRDVADMKKFYRLKVPLAICKDVEHHKMGARGCKLAEEKYTWDAVVKAMVKGYSCLTCWIRK